MSFCLVTQKNKYKKAGYVNSKVSWLLGMTGLFLSYGVHAQEVYMEAGESQVIQVDGSIDTIFISAPKVADYEIIGDRGVMVYAKSDGQTDLIAFDKNGDQLIKTTLVVDPILSAVQKKVGQLVPDSQISIQKVGKTYILNGTVPTEEDRDRVYQIVGEGVGAKRTANKKDVPSTSGGSGGGSEGSNAWLDEVVYQEVINKLKLPTTNQVNVKLSVVEVTKTFSDNVGIDWGTISGTSGNITPGTFRFVKFNADTLSSLVHAISNDSVARVLAEPNLSVLSGESAEFLVGGEVPVVTSSANGSNVQYKDFGIKLNVGAKVSSSQRIRVTLGEEVSNVDSTYSTNAGDSFPAFQTRRAKTTVELADGESFLLGGLISNNEREDLSRLPFIGDVPILGALFRNAKTERTRGELVVATVNLVKPVTMRDIVLPDFQRTSTLARFMNFEGISNLRDRKLAEGFVEQGGFIK
ncbi:type II and III secretion system protein family protein [Obesumbacterium proteus]|nr:type II and III secretion system protein family protein [Obesumbacterium proteus]